MESDCKKYLTLSGLRALGGDSRIQFCKRWRTYQCDRDQESF